MSTDINISNYESYLYCYVDGELNADEKAALERFAAANPQVRAELDLLLATRLQPENIVFDNKASLYRGSEIHLQNYESYLLSYIDGELNPEEELAFEQFMARHPKVRQELVMWQGTKQHADPSIRFEDKSLLYRHTKTRTIRMRPAYWWAAAAMVAGVLAFFQLSDRSVADQTPVLADVEKVQPATKEEGAGGQKTDQAHSAVTDEPGGQAASPESGNPAALAATSDNKPDEQVAYQKPATKTPSGNQTADDKRSLPAKPPVATKQLIAAAPQAKQPEVTGEAPATSMDLASIRTEKTTAIEIDKQQLEATLRTPLKEVPRTETAMASGARPSLEDQTPPATLATPAPAPAPPGELIMSVTGNGLESKVLDKVTNVARFFARKKK
ncbi:hypothetical protein [Chitinophaga cymbidii]|uniref:Zinc-finger domain-containing protein n=1 Tax=Chitinophaga cymbidii TaxID=1096750 RepID=A0A512RHV3_9BACT|nr:hypothetical protein [Chitinophaga cymbidii]GEP95286.1 hypothetical protein CCY01nite_15460 [Chitinophaga cymbidii]